MTHEQALRKKLKDCLYWAKVRSNNPRKRNGMRERGANALSAHHHQTKQLSANMTKITTDRQPERVATQIVGNAGMYYTAFRLSQRGWNAMPTTKNAKGPDL